jgi:hypothetical protein
VRPKPKEIRAFNYCLSFIDILGQRKALEGQGLLPQFRSDDERKAFLQTIKNTIGAIRTLQKQSDTMIRAIVKPRKNSAFRKSLSPELQAEWDEMQRTRVTTQRWSDGIVHFVSLGDNEIKCAMNGVFSVIVTAGSLCLMGLALHRPVRGAVDIAWGVELHKGELYGAAVARAYELESEYAQYPRIVVSPRIVNHLHAQAANTSNDCYSQFNKSLADVCLGLVTPDADGLPFVHYLGENFINFVSRAQHPDLYARALNFITEQAARFRTTRDTKLAFRYSHLERYFHAHPPVHLRR